MPVDYRTALNPEQAQEMRLFLNTLLRAADMAKEAGVKPDIDLFMRAWIGLPINDAEKKERCRANARHRDAMKRQQKRGV